MTDKNKQLLHVSSSERNAVEIDEYMTVYEYFTKEQIDGASLVTADLDGPHSRRVNYRSEKTYYVLDGELEVTVEGETEELSEGDSAVIPPEAYHSLVGHNAEIIMVSSPPYDPADENIE